MSIETFQIPFERRQNKQHFDNKIIYIVEEKKGYDNYKEDKHFFVKRYSPPALLEHLESFCSKIITNRPTV